MRANKLWLAPLAAALALPALAQQMVPVVQPGTPTPTPMPSTATSQPTTSSTSASTKPRTTTPSTGSLEGETGVTEISADQISSYTPPVELPEHARRDPWVVGASIRSSSALGAIRGAERVAPSCRA